MIFRTRLNIALFIFKLYGAIPTPRFISTESMHYFGVFCHFFSSVFLRGEKANIGFIGKFDGFFAVAVVNTAKFGLVAFFIIHLNLLNS